MLEKTFTALGAVGVILLVLALFVVGPWLSILAINQLFGTAIQLTFWNWLSMTWLHLLIAKGKSKS